MIEIDAELWEHYPSGSLGTQLFRAVEPVTDSYSEAGRLTSSDIEAVATIFGSGLFNGPETTSRSGHRERNGLTPPEAREVVFADAFDSKSGRNLESPG